jgi:hypothetical protein
MSSFRPSLLLGDKGTGRIGTRHKSEVKDFQVVLYARAALVSGSVLGQQNCVTLFSSTLPPFHIARWLSTGDINTPPIIQHQGITVMNVIL